MVSRNCFSRYVLHLLPPERAKDHALTSSTGKAPGTYNLLLGGGYHGQRLNKLYRASVKEEEILEILKPMFKSYAETKNEGEHFGDWTIRTGIIAETTAGLNFYENTGEDEEEE